MKKTNKPQLEKAASLHGFIMLFKPDEKYYFQFNDRDGEPLLFSKAYSTEKNCTDGIQAIIRAAGVEERYDLNETKKGKFFFILNSSNHKEVCRSRIFDTQEDMEEQLAFLKSIDEQVPQYGIQPPSIETKLEKPEILEKPVEIPEKKPKTTKTANLQPSLSEGVDKMPRYKFSMIYYPDSKIWTIKSDFSDGSLNLKTCDGPQIETFIISQLPAEERDAPQLSTDPVVVVKPREASPAPAQSPSQESEIILRTHDGKRIGRFAEASSIDKVEVQPLVAKPAQPAIFDAKVMAKSMENNQTIFLGAVESLPLVNGQLEIPIYGAKNLKKGLYRFSVDVNLAEEEIGYTYYGNQLIMLT
jgi:uncharacterized protein YegP (UPF0339 family)